MRSPRCSGTWSLHSVLLLTSTYPSKPRSPPPDAPHRHLARLILLWLLPRPVHFGTVPPQSRITAARLQMEPRHDPHLMHLMQVPPPPESSRIDTLLPVMTRVFVIHPAGYGSRLQAQHPHCAAHGRKRKGEPERLASKRRRSKARRMRESLGPFGVLIPLRCFVCTLTDGGEGCNHGMPSSTPSEAAPFQAPYKVSHEPIADDDRSPIGGSQHRETRLCIHNLLQPLSLSTVSCMPTAAGPQ
jgi:hypothetical protein